MLSSSITDTAIMARGGEVEEGILGVWEADIMPWIKLGEE
jgi:hypothetical protein